MIPEDLDHLSDDDIKTLYHGILAMRRTPAGKQLIDRSIQEIRSGKFQVNNRPQPVKATEAFVNALENEPESFLDR